MVKPARAGAHFVSKDNVIYIQPLDDTKPPNLIIPGVARVPRTSFTNRWHQQLDHPGQTIP